ASWYGTSIACGAARSNVAARSRCPGPDSGVRRRRYSFECDDGSSFTQDVEKTVECG
ncbi:hypothetical protein M9458_043174, partial [Cirrhinus mrigala]